MFIREGFVKYGQIYSRRNVDKPALVLELKYNQSAETAISQIRNKQYPDALCDYVGEVVLVGISYDKAKGHTCKIDRISIESVREIGQRKSVRENRSEKSVREYQRG